MDRFDLNGGNLYGNKLYGNSITTYDPGHIPNDSLKGGKSISCLLYTSPSPRDRTRSRMPSSA